MGQMSNEEAARILDPETSRETLAPYAHDCQLRLAVTEEACTVAAKVLRDTAWVSVEEKLPEDDLPPNSDRVSIKVLTVTKHGKRRFVRELTRQRRELLGVMRPWCWSRDAIGVTHWMPLPEPPQEVD